MKNLQTFEEFSEYFVNESKHPDLRWLKLPPDENAIEQLLVLATNGKCSMPYNFTHQDVFKKLAELGKVKIYDGIVTAIKISDPIWKIIWNELRTSRGQLKYLNEPRTYQDLENDFLQTFEKLTYGKISNEEFEKIETGDEVSYGGTRYIVKSNTGVILNLQSVDGNSKTSVNYNQFLERGALLESATVSWGSMMRAVRSGGPGPWSIVVIENQYRGKVIDQDFNIKTRDLLPAAFEEMRRKYPIEKIYIEDGNGRVVWIDKK